MSDHARTLDVGGWMGVVGWFRFFISFRIRRQRLAQDWRHGRGEQFLSVPPHARDLLLAARDPFFVAIRPPPSTSSSWPFFRRQYSNAIRIRFCTSSANRIRTRTSSKAVSSAKYSHEQLTVTRARPEFNWPITSGA